MAVYDDVGGRGSGRRPPAVLATAVLALAVRGVGAILALVTLALVARLGDSGALARAAAVFVAAQIMGALALFGGDLAVLRGATGGVGDTRLAASRGVALQELRRLGLLLTAAGVAALVMLVVAGSVPVVRMAALALLLAPSIALPRLVRSLYQSTGETTQGQTIEFVAPPGVTITLMAIASFWMPVSDVTFTIAWFVANLVVAGLGGITWRFRYRGEATTYGKVGANRWWDIVALTLAPLILGMDLLVVSGSQAGTDAGGYAVAARLSGLVIMASVAINGQMVPLFTRNQIDEWSRASRPYALLAWGLLAACVGAAILLIFPDAVAEIIFGPRVTMAKSTLSILLCANILYLATGPGLSMAIVQGHGQSAAAVLAIVTVFEIFAMAFVESLTAIALVRGAAVVIAFAGIVILVRRKALLDTSIVGLWRPIHWR